MTTFLRRHWLLLLLLAGGLTLRVIAWFAYQPTIVYIDSFRYLNDLKDLPPTGLNPLGYTFILKGLLEFGGLSFVAAVQHVVGVLLAIVLYLLALRYTSRTWLAAIVAAPVLMDAYQIQIEENIMSEVWFQTALVGALWLLLSKGEPNWWRAGFAGALIGYAVITRTIGVVVLVPVVIYLVIAGRAWASKAGWMRIGARVGAALVGVSIVLGSYGLYFQSHTGYFGLTVAQGNVLYGRTAVVADCSLLPPNDKTLQRFCPKEPLDQRKSIDFYTHFQYGNPDWPGTLPPGRTKADLASQFATRVIREQPVDFALAILQDFAKNFAPVKTTSYNDVPAERWQFQIEYPYYDIGANRVDYYHAATLAFDGVLPSTNEDLTTFLRAYQLGGGYTWGPLLAVFLLTGTLGALGVGKARRSGLRSAALLATGSALIILAGSAAFEFSWRYQLPALVLLPLGGVLGLAAMLGWGKKSRRSGTGVSGKRPKMDDFPDHVDTAAIAAFKERYGEDTKLNPLVVVIAAYNEATGITPVLQNMPEHVGDLPTSTLVVVDGATDNTAEVAEKAGAYVCDAPENRGQGGALRLGYHLATQLGARYIVTTDADGQYDNGEMPMLVKPLLDGSADFVTGSRRLGSEQADSKVRWLGVRVFATLASVLTMRKITDTSFGFRAMTSELATSVILREPQYQASELLLSAAASGARILEVPLSMNLRNNGKSKKGKNAIYGANYARVMTGTWLREYVLRAGRRQKRSGRAK